MIVDNLRAIGDTFVLRTASASESTIATWAGRVDLRNSRVAELADALL